METTGSPPVPPSRAGSADHRIGNLVMRFVLPSPELGEPWEGVHVDQAQVGLRLQHIHLSLLRAIARDTVTTMAAVPMTTPSMVSMERSLRRRKLFMAAARMSLHFIVFQGAQPAPVRDGADPHDEGQDQSPGQRIDLPGQFGQHL